MNEFNPNIKPIETKYNGYKFRSRLEARWAVFFDSTGIIYQYEPEGFDLGRYGWYLPDFYLPQYNAYVEIKPLYLDQDKWNADRQQIMDKCEILFAKTDRWTLLCFGDPLDNRMYLYSEERDDDGGGPLESPCAFSSSAMNDEPPAIYVELHRDDMWLCTQSGKPLESEYVLPLSQSTYEYVLNIDTGEYFTVGSACISSDIAASLVTLKSKVFNARYLARQIQFDHGFQYQKTPVPRIRNSIISNHYIGRVED